MVEVMDMLIILIDHYTLCSHIKISHPINMYNYYMSPENKWEKIHTILHPWISLPSNALFKSYSSPVPMMEPSTVHLTPVNA